ncbi:MAG: M1 family metallopeptidase, partial [Bradymonadia bacterium]
MQQRPRTQWFCLLLVSFLIGGCTWFKQVLPGGNQLPNHDVRLSETVTPLSYDLLLRLNPSQRKYSGSVKIEVALSKQHGAIDLHAKHLSISDARFILNQETQTLRIDRLDDSFVRLSSQSVLPLGRGVIDLTFSGQLSQTPDGLYTVQDGGQFYIFSQFEPIAARTAFPCFDEPRFKTPFKIAVEIPDEQLAVSNAPEEKRVKIESGGTRFVFKPTRPIPTYLVAFGIGPLDVVETDVKLDGTVPFRIVVPKGKGDKTAFAIRETPSIYESLKQYLGASYPYQKLDFLAVPNFKAGAMENPGLVTYREPLLLVDETKVTPGRLRSIRGVIAHELAHMWFGNSVTLAWWNDIWLNEAFATWMADHVEIALNDQARALRSIARSKHRVM